MSTQTEPREKFLYEFDGFRVDPIRRVLSRLGEPLPIKPKAMSILLALLERPGEVVEKAELLERVWPGVVVADANLTQNIFSLRKSLGDSANEPRYILTVPGEGYRFGAEVARVEKGSSGEVRIVTDVDLEAFDSPRAGERAPLDPEPLEDSAAGVPAAAMPAGTAAPPRRWNPWRIPALTLGTLLTLLVAGLTLFGTIQIGRRVLWAPEEEPAVRESVAVLDFQRLGPKNQVEWMENALAEMLTTELAAGGRMRVIRRETVTEAMRSLRLRNSGRLSGADLQNLHAALGADYVVVGSFTPVGNRIRLDLRVLTLPEGTLEATLARVGTQPALFDLIARTGSGLRDALGLESLSPEQVRQAEALRPDTPEAERLYHEGVARLRAFDPPGALGLLQRAAQADPDSAVIRTALSRAWSVLGYDARAKEEAGKAVDLSAALSKEVQLATRARFHQASKSWDEASQTYRALWTFTPDDVDYGLQLAECLMMGGHSPEAAQTLQALRRLPGPAGRDPRIDLMEARNSRRLFDFATQRRAAETAARKGRQSGQLLIVSQALISQGDSLVQTGRPREALPLFEEARALAAGAGYQWGVGQALGSEGYALQALGDLEGAEKAHRESLEIAERLGSGIGIAYQLFILGGLAQEKGELDRALALLDQALAKYRALGDRVMQLRVLNSAGAVLTSRGELDAARERFEQALELSYALRHTAYEARSLDYLGTALASQGRLGEARSHHEKAFAMLDKLGDPSLASTAQYGAANVQARLGQLAAAWERSGKALETKRRIGDRLGAGRVLGLRSRIAWLRGDLVTARALAGEKLRIAQETGAKPQAANALHLLGGIAHAAGDLQESRRLLQRALENSLEVGEALRASEVRLDLATLALAQENPGQAAALAREASAWYGARKIPGGEAQALAILAESLADQGRGAAARQAADRARALMAETEDRTHRLSIAVRLARLEATQGRRVEAVRELRQASQDAKSLGLLSAGLEAQLALGEVQRSLGAVAEAEDTLDKVRREASAHGFKGLALLAGGEGPAAEIKEAR